MSIPKFYEFFGSFLRAIQDGRIHKSKEVQQFIAEDMNLSDADLLEMLPSGRQSTFGNRVNWARTYLDKAGLIETPSRGQYRITDVGKAALNSGDTIDLKYLEQFEAFQRFHTVQHGNESGTETSVIDSSTEEEQSPMETLDAAFNTIPC